tara:strand:+ start:730 stop:930 length:201 start_codon:yes stop_codon:yes gene_type:complete
MANYHIKKTSVMPGVGDVYYEGSDGQWSDDFSKRKIYTNKSTTQALFTNNDGKNGGWTGATVVGPE